MKYNLQGPQRKVVHAALCEIFAIALTTAAVRLASDASTGHATGLALATSLIAVSWNMAFNALFEAWERRQASRVRSVGRRVAHTVLFEAGLVLSTVPMIAWWMTISWAAALVADLGLVALFLVYTFCFNWAFDHVFGLPASAQAAH